jgi:hypothetical protein
MLMLHAGTSIVASIILTYEDFDSTKHRKHDACLVYIIAILGPNVCIAEFILNHLKPLSDLVIYIVVIALLIHWSTPPPFETWMALGKCLGPVP